MFECTPISDFWNIEDISNNKWGCINIIVMDVFTNSWSAFEDLVIWALPIPILWNLKVPSAKKCSSRVFFPLLVLLVHPNCLRWLTADTFARYSRSLHFDSYFLHFRHLRRHPRRSFRDLDQLVGYLVEFSNLPAPLHHRVLRRSHHFLTLRHLSALPQTGA